jgi:molecular chaperone GrpE (heat shock protein)
MNQKKSETISKLIHALDDLQRLVETLRNEQFKSEADQAAVTAMQSAVDNLETTISTHYWYA